MLKILRTGVAAMALLTAGAVTGPAFAAAQAEKILPGDYVLGAWELYKSLFVHDGRVIDTSNGNISHSEGQGYGMLMAAAAGDRVTFDAIWDWTQRELYRRPDHLASWKWDPAAGKGVVDTNNATDGDLLIGWALAVAGRTFNDPSLIEKAVDIARDIAAHAVIELPRYGKVLLPAASGFDAASQPDGPVVNLSYWVYPALVELQAIDPEFPGDALIESGLSLLKSARFGDSQLPADWISLGGDFPRPAQKFPPNFGYEAIRIPLYTVWYDQAKAPLLEKFAKRWNSQGRDAVQVVELSSASSLVAMGDPGYRAVSQLLECSLGRTARTQALSTFEPTEYYPSTLYLMSIIAVTKRYPQCLEKTN